MNYIHLSRHIDILNTYAYAQRDGEMEGAGLKTWHDAKHILFGFSFNHNIKEDLPNTA